MQGGNGSEARTVRLEYPDNDTYHQTGWDIRVTDRKLKNDGDGYYFHD